MDRERAISMMREHAQDMKILGVTGLFLFGSAARDEMRDGSDIGLYLNYDENARFTLFTLAHLKNYLSDLLGTEIDVTTRRGLHPVLRDEIESSSVQVF